MISESQAKDLLLAKFDVSRETLADLQNLRDTLIKWGKSINLVSKSTFQEIWARHILDSAQLWTQVAPETKLWVDIGSGGGFPGLVLAILAKHKRPDLKFVLIESDARKCAFLKFVSRETSLNTKIVNSRIEDVPDIRADVVSARALAPIAILMQYSYNLLNKRGFCLFLKGRSYAIEMENTHAEWTFQSNVIQSVSQDDSVVIKMWDIKHAEN